MLQVLINVESDTAAADVDDVYDGGGRSVKSENFLKKVNKLYPHLFIHLVIHHVFEIKSFFCGKRQSQSDKTLSEITRMRCHVSIKFEVDQTRDGDWFDDEFLGRVCQDATMKNAPPSESLSYEMPTTQTDDWRWDWGLWIQPEMLTDDGLLMDSFSLHDGEMICEDLETLESVEEQKKKSPAHEMEKC